RRSQPQGIAPRHAIPDQESDHRADELTALELHATQLATEPSVEVAQRALALGVAIVRHPACGEAVHLLDHPFPRAVAPVATGDLPQAVLGAGRTLAPDAKCAPSPQTEPAPGRLTRGAEELAFPDRGD